eukprot:scaffold60321_cov32-Tisochrysis_lutea.AAC.4
MARPWRRAVGRAKGKSREREKGKGDLQPPRELESFDVGWPPHWVFPLIVTCNLCHNLWGVIMVMGAGGRCVGGRFEGIVCVSEASARVKVYGQVR